MRVFDEKVLTKLDLRMECSVKLFLTTVEDRMHGEMLDEKERRHNVWMTTASMFYPE